MPMNDTFAAIVTNCSSKLRRVRDYLELDCHLYETSADLERIEIGLSTVLQQHDSDIRQRDTVITTLRNEVAAKRQAFAVAQQQVAELEARASRRDDVVKQCGDELKKLKDDLIKARASAADAYQRGIRDGREAEGVQQTRPHGVDETHIVKLLQRGRELFASSNFAIATPILQQAKTKITILTRDRRQLYDTSELHHQLAVCGAYVNDIDAAKASLESFLKCSSISTPEEVLYAAHVQHLLSQVQIGRGRLADAESLCNKAFSTRERYLSASSGERAQTTALSARIMELRCYPGADLLREAIPSNTTREELRQAYDRLAPLTEVNRSNNLAILPPSATELLPIWTITMAQAKPTPKPQPPPQPQPRPPQMPQEPSLNVMTKDLWMRQMQLASRSGPILSSDLKRAIVLGDASLVQNILQTQRSTIAAPALHLAALFGDVAPAKLLLSHGMNVNETCDARSDNGGHLHGVTALHLAIGAQHDAMIRLLLGHGAKFDRAMISGKTTVAPPMWLILDRWLTMTGKDSPKQVVGTLQTLRSLGWNTKSPLNKGGETIRDVIISRMGHRPELQKALLGFLG